MFSMFPLRCSNQAHSLCCPVVFHLMAFAFVFRAFRTWLQTSKRVERPRQPPKAHLYPLTCTTAYLSAFCPCPVDASECTRFTEHIGLCVWGLLGRSRIHTLWQFPSWSSKYPLFLPVSLLCTCIYLSFLCTRALSRSLTLTHTNTLIDRHKKNDGQILIGHYPHNWGLGDFRGHHKVTSPHLTNPAGGC